ncbi:MAG: T9SS type A sorting domain-containing protein [Bacteroidetes bacterium]|nr:T9SS type A sorting domain-containing protein [Bacteroidota bacterium]MBU1115112.1 T9SS type A sorting domain-containing protein [Bacteroidota bacterium]MBU1798200.1 T9SS type A sorting domain-containing protein [Bacteroidota bacterium]
MNKIIPILSFLVLLTYSLLGQTVVSVSNVTSSSTGVEVLVPINATVNDVGSVNLNLKYDKDVLTFVEVANNSLTGGVFVVNPHGDTLSIAWFSESPVNIVAKILDLKFVYNGGTSAVSFVGTNQIANGLANPISATFTNGSVGPVAPDPTSLKLNDVTGLPGDTVDVEMSAVNLENIGAMNLYLNYDDSKATFLGMSDINLAGFVANGVADRINLGMFNADGFNHAAGVIATFRFVIIAGNTDIDFDASSFVQDVSFNNIAMVYTSGSIGEVVINTSFILGDVNAVAGSEVSVPLSALKISNIGSFNIDVLFDASKLEFVRVDNVVSGSLVANAVNGVLSLGYFNSDGLNITDGKLADLVFNYSGGSSAVTFDVASANIIDLSFNPVTLTFVDGSVSELMLPSFVNTLPDTSIEVGSTLTYVYTGTHPSSAALTFSLVSGPDGAVIDATSGAFSWTPVNGQDGVYDIVAGLSDGVTLVIDSAIVTVTGQIIAEYPVIEAATDGTLDQPWTFNALGGVGTLEVVDSTASAWGSHAVRYTDAAYTGLALINKVFTESYTVSSDIYLEGAVSATFPLYTGLAIKSAKDELKYYRFIYRNSSTDMGQLKLQGYDGAAWHISKSWNVGTEISQLSTGWHNFKITIDGEKLYAYMDNKLLSGCPIAVTGADAFLTEGMPGIFVYTTANGVVTFDNFKVEENKKLEYTIAEIQTPNEGDTLGVSPYVGLNVITTGVVTAAQFNSDGSAKQFYVQNGYGAYNGILVYSKQMVAVGDSITFEGKVAEYNGKTELINVNGLTKNASGKALPMPVALSTGAVNDEQYEGVLVTIANAENTEENSNYGEAKFNDGTGEILTDDLLKGAYAFVLGNIYDITGVVDYAYGSYRILYRDSSDVVDHGAPQENVIALDHNTGNLVVSVFNNGTIGANKFDGINYGSGFQWKGNNGFWRGGPVFGTAARGSVNGQANNNDPANFFDLTNVNSDFTSGFYTETAGTVEFDQVADAIFTDGLAANPYGLDITQKSYSKTGEDVVYLEYTFANNTGAAIDGFSAGIFMDLDVEAGGVTYGSNNGGYSKAEELVYVYAAGTGGPYFGVVAIDKISGAKVTSTNAADANALRVAGYGFITTFDENDKPVTGDQRMWIGSNLNSIPDGSTAKVMFAFVAADDLHDIRANAANAFDLGRAALFTDYTTSVEDLSGIPTEYNITQNYPNPFNPSTTIEYALPAQSNVKINVYNTLGQLVTKLVDSDITAGYHQVQFNASNLSSGVYFYSIQAESIDGSKNFQIVKKMMLVK